MLPQAHGTKAIKIKCFRVGINVSKSVDTERSGPPKNYRDDKDSGKFTILFVHIDVEISERWLRNSTKKSRDIISDKMWA
jgi:hypothetical protein